MRCPLPALTAVFLALAAISGWCGDNRGIGMGVATASHAAARSSYNLEQEKHVGQAAE